jgi:WS/DGAT/MGAT family acyltransferase
MAEAAEPDARPARHGMSRVDTAWLRMDNDVNLMMIVGVWMLASRVSLQAVRERVATKLLQYDRFRQRVQQDAMGASWVEDDNFDIERHVSCAPLPRHEGESERAALQRACGEMACTPLDPRHPLWHFQLVEDYEGGSALLVRIHHCIADGIALISVMQSITDGGSDPPRRRRRAAPAEPEGDWLSDAVLKPLTELTSKAIAMYGDGVARSIDALSHPQQPLLGSLEMARVGYKVLSDVAALALLADDSPTRLKGKPEGRKVVAWCEPLPLDQVKAIGKGLHCSVNDVLLSCAAGAIGSYLRDLGDDPDGAEIRAMVPVNLRPLEQAWKLGNRFGLAPMVLPIGIANPIERVYAVRSRMAELKGSYQPLLAFAILSLTGLLIKPAQDAILGLFAKKTTAVMTNVPGPSTPLSFCGATLRQNLFWVPASGDVGMGVSILSYAGGVQFGLITDRRLCPDPQRIIDRFGDEFEKLLLVAMMLPWAGQDVTPEAAASRPPHRAAARSASPRRARAASGGRGRAPSARSSASPP